MEKPSHICPVNGCRARVAHNMLMCGEHWSLVPKAIANEVWRTFRTGRGGIAHTMAMRRAIESVDDQIRQGELKL